MVYSCLLYTSCRQTEGLPHPLAWIGTARKKWKLWDCKEVSHWTEKTIGTFGGSDNRKGRYLWKQSISQCGVRWKRQRTESQICSYAGNWWDTISWGGKRFGKSLWKMCIRDRHFIELKEHIFSKGDKLKKNPELLLYYVCLLYTSYPERWRKGSTIKFYGVDRDTFLGKRYSERYRTVPVSYTHLDVYKRQSYNRRDGIWKLCSLVPLK